MLNKFSLNTHTRPRRTNIQVVFSSNRSQPYKKYNLGDCLFDEKYKIYFENKAIKQAFNKLLTYECVLCSKGKSVASPAKSNNDTPNGETGQQKPSLNNATHRDKQSKTNRRDVVKHRNESAQESLSSRSPTDPTLECQSSASTDALDEETQGLLKSSDIKGSVFRDVFGLKNHLNYMHKLKLCDLCLTHNKLFPFEYSYYDFQALRKHMRDGERNTSHRGHPGCQLCHQIFFNNDELIQHMSREHYHCHLCGRHDSNKLIYFLDYESLRDHFKIKHYLCERGNCKYEQFTSAFDTKIDYQLHVVQVHGNPTTNLSRGEARHQRTIVLDSAPHRARDISPARSMSHNMQPNSAIVSTGPMATANSTRLSRPESMRAEIIQQRLPTRAEFPALGQNTASQTRQIASPAPQTYVNQYPSLIQTSSSQVTANTSENQGLTAGPSTMRGSFVRTAGGGIRQPEQFGAMDFPPLPEQPKSKKTKKKIVSNRTNGRSDNNVVSLDQLISSSLTISNESARASSKRASNSKTGTVKSQKSVKSRPLKIQLS